MTVTLLPDIERLLSNYLRANSDVTALVGTNIYTVMPKNAAGDPSKSIPAKFPLVRLTRISGAPIFSLPLRFDQARIQIDCYGGSKQLAWQTAATIAAVIADGFVGTHTEGVVSDAQIGTLQDLPDDTFDPAQPRWILDVVITARPA